MYSVLGEEDPYREPANSVCAICQQMSSRREAYSKISPEDIVLLDELGQGEFGVVHRGGWSSPNGQKEAAVKCLRGNQEEEKRVRLLQEAFTMGQFKHPHVVQLYGVVKSGDMVRRRWPLPPNCSGNALECKVSVCSTMFTGDAGHGAPPRRRPQELLAQCSEQVSITTNTVWCLARSTAKLPPSCLLLLSPNHTETANVC